MIKTKTKTKSDDHTRETKCAWSSKCLLYHYFQLLFSYQWQWKLVSIFHPSLYLELWFKKSETATTRNVFHVSLRITAFVASKIFKRILQKLGYHCLRRFIFPRISSQFLLRTWSEAKHLANNL